MPGRSRGTAVRAALAFMLTFGTGALDAIVFLRLGRVFASVITGDVVLVGLGLAEPQATVAVHAGLACGAYYVGSTLGAVAAGRAVEGQPLWPARVNLALAIEWVPLATLVAVWTTGGPFPTGDRQLVLLGLAATAMGVQSAAVNRLAVEGFSTTYLTSTLVRAATELPLGPRRPVPKQLAALAALLAGATAGVAINQVAPGVGTLLTAALLTVVLAAAVVLGRRGGILAEPAGGD